ncbi:Uncharacterised protein [Vibrio cholerae]|nr:Uncharacterised protein [Vibrio cholerae]
MCFGDDVSQIAHFTGCTRVLQQCAKSFLLGDVVNRIDFYLKAKECGASFHHFNGLWMHVIGNKEQVAFALACALTQCHRFGRRCRFIQQ